MIECLFIYVNLDNKFSALTDDYNYGMVIHSKLNNYNEKTSFISIFTMLYLLVI